MVDAAVQRLNMVDSQVRPSDVTDRRIARAMLEVRREDFVPASQHSLAYSDGDVPLGKGPRALLAPRVFAKLLQLANIAADDVVLDVGCATGYSTAVLSRLSGRVVGLECDAELAKSARDLVGGDADGRVTIATGPLAGGHTAGGAYDVIVLEGSVPQAPTSLYPLLKDGGRLVGIVQRDGLSRAVVVQRSGEVFSETAAFDAAAVALPGFARSTAFTL